MLFTAVYSVSMTQTKTPQVGDVRTWDFQSDTFRGQYRLISHDGGDLWTAERLAPTDEICEAILAYACSVDPATHSWMSDLDQVEAEIEYRRWEAGSTFKIRLVTRDQFDRAF